MDRGAWQATIHGVTKSWARLSDSHTQCGERAEVLSQGVAKCCRQAANMCQAPFSVFPTLKPCSISGHPPAPTCKLQALRLTVVVCTLPSRAQEGVLGEDPVGVWD